MASDVPRKVIERHNLMVFILRRSTSQEDFENLKQLLQDGPLTAVDLNKIQDMSVLFHLLRIKGFIDYGDYKRIVRKLQLINPDLCAIVNKCTEDIDKILKQKDLECGVVSMDQSTYHVKEGSTAYLDCTVDPVPDAIIWIRDGMRIFIDNRKYFAGCNSAPTLVIRHLEKKIDEGHYQCTAIFNKTRVYGDIVQLKVYPSGSEPTEDPSGSEPTEDESKLRMRVISDKEKDPSGSEPTEDESKLRMRLISDMEKDPSGSEPTEDETKLRLRLISDKEKDPSGSEPTEDESKLRMRLISDMEKDPSGSEPTEDPSGSEPTEGLPVVIITQNFYTVTSGQTVVLECTVHASPTHTNVVWQRIDNGVATILTIDGNKYSGSSVNKPSLTITGANSNDNTVYTCSATNAVGTGTSGQTSLTVTENVHEKESTYKQSMKKKTQTQTIKLTFIGHARAGKTCLMRQLLGKHIKLGGPDPTNVADLLTKRLRYQLGKSSKERENIKKGEEAEMCRQRLRMLRKRREDKEMATENQSNDLSIVDSSGGHDGGENTDYLEEGREEEPRPVVNERMPPILTEDQRKAVEDINMENDTIDDSSVAYVTLFDFGGDKVFYNCHHCIMSANSIYLLVFDVSLWETPGKQDRIVDEIVYWLNSVATHATDETDKRDGRPPIILIGSHMDKVTTVVEKDIRKKICKNLREKSGIEPIMDDHVQQYFFIGDMNDSEKNKKMYDLIWEAIEKCVHLQSCWQEHIAGTWLALEEKVMLEKEKGKGIKFLNIQQILDLNGELLVPLQEKELVPFLRYLHNAASIFCFDIIGIPDSRLLTDQEKQQMNAILDPSWIVNAYGAIITDDKFVKLNDHKEEETWERYKLTAELTNKVLNLRWKEITDEDRQVLLSVMVNLGLITVPMKVPYRQRLRPSPHQTYIVPCLLDEAESGCIQHILNNDRVHFTKTLCLIFENQFVPQAIWDKTVAMCMHEFSPCTYQEKGIKRIKLDYLSPKRGFICRNFDDIWNFVLHCKGAMLKLTMFNHHKQHVRYGVGRDLRHNIERIIKDILSMTNHGHRVFHFDYFHCDFWIADHESASGKPNKKTLMKCTEYTVYDTMGNQSSLTPADCQAWFGDVNKIPAKKKFSDIKRVKQIHATMVRELSEWIGPGLKKEWTSFLTELDPYLGRNVLYGVDDNSMSKICGCLMEQGVIDYGRYDELREIVNSIHVKAAAVIDQAMDKMSVLRLSRQ